jgi:hypothetical protein
MFRPHPPPKIHHPCGADDCMCPVTSRLISRAESRPYEVQMDKYKCGPVAVINALLYLEKDPGPALRRSIITQCKTAPVHEDGFKGTKPNDIHGVIQKVIPNVKHFIGIHDAIAAFKNRSYTAYIVLYSGYRQNKKQYYHYTFTFKTKAGRSPIFLSQNDGSDKELEWTLNSFCEEHFSIEDNIPIVFPQIWAF